MKNLLSANGIFFTLMTYKDNENFISRGEKKKCRGYLFYKFMGKCCLM